MLLFMRLPKLFKLYKYAYSTFKKPFQEHLKPGCFEGLFEPSTFIHLCSGKWCWDHYYDTQTIIIVCIYNPGLIACKHEIQCEIATLDEIMRITLEV